MNRERTCIGCGCKKDKTSMYRIVKTPDRRICYDPSGRAAGRGAYICSLECLEKAAAKKRLAAALKCSVSDSLSEEIDRCVSMSDFSKMR